MNKLTPEEQISALNAKCALLAASLKQAEAEGRRDTRRAYGELEDCANMFGCYNEYHWALLKAIEKFTGAGDKDSTKELDLGDCETVKMLANIGDLLADQAWSSSQGYVKKAQAMREAR